MFSGPNGRPRHLTRFYVLGSSTTRLYDIKLNEEIQRIDNFTQWEVVYRPDNRVYTASTGGGRSWAKVELYLSSCDITKASRTFTMNPTSTPTRVFNKAVTWPTWTGKPASQPGSWDLQFPFGTAAHRYSNKSTITPWASSTVNTSNSSSEKCSHQL